MLPCLAMERSRLQACCASLTGPLTLRCTNCCEPYHSHIRLLLFSDGEIVPPDIGLWHMDLGFRAGMFAVEIVPIPAGGGSFVRYLGRTCPYGVQNCGGPANTVPPVVKA